MPGSPGSGAPGSPRPSTNGVGETTPDRSSSVRTDAAAELERLARSVQKSEEDFSQS